jgi:hypothetical protein
LIPNSQLAGFWQRQYRQPLLSKSLEKAISYHLPVEPGSGPYGGRAHAVSWSTSFHRVVFVSLAKDRSVFVSLL